MKAPLAFLSLILLFGIASPAFAQEGKFLPGYVLPSEGDTLRGYLKVRHADFMAKRIQYKSSKEATEVTRYKPDEIAGYGFEKGEVYVSRTTDRGGPFFLHWFFDGELDFYYLRDSVDHYYVADGGALIHLMDTEQIIVREGQRKLFRKREYVGQLMRVIEDFSLQPIVDETELNQKSLIKLGRAYQEKTKPGVAPMVHQMARKPFRVRQELVGDWFSEQPHISGAKYNTVDSSHQAFGFGLVFQNLPIASDRLFLRTGATLGKWARSRGVFFFPDARRNPLMIRIPLSASYRLLRTSLYPSIGVGGAHYRVIDNNPPSPTNYTNLLTGVGLHYEGKKYGMFSLYLRYEVGFQADPRTDFLAISLAVGL